MDFVVMVTGIIIRNDNSNMINKEKKELLQRYLVILKATASYVQVRVAGWRFHDISSSSSRPGLN